MPDLTHPYFTGCLRPTTHQITPPIRHPYNRPRTRLRTHPMPPQLPPTPFPPHHLSLSYTLTTLLHTLSNLMPYSTSSQGQITYPTTSPAEAEIFDALGMLIGRTLFEAAINLINSGRMVQYVLPRLASDSSHMQNTNTSRPSRPQRQRDEIPNSDSESDDLSPSPSPPPPELVEEQKQPESAPESLAIYAFLPPHSTSTSRRPPAPITTLLPSWHCTCAYHTASLLRTSHPVIPPFPSTFPSAEDGYGENEEYDAVRGVFKWGGYYGVGGERAVEGCEHLVAAALVEGVPGLGRWRVKERVGRRGEVAGLMVGRG